MTNRTWTGGASGNFKVAGNWSPAAVPGSGDQAVIDTASTVELAIGNAETITLASLNLSGTATLDIDNGGSNTGTFIIGGGSTSSILNSVLQVANTDMFAQGTISNEGTISLLSGAQLQTSGSTLTLTAEANGEVQLQGASIGGRIAVGGTGTFDTLVLTDQDIVGFGSIGRNGFLDTLNIDMLNGATIDANAGAALRLDVNITQGNFSKLLADGGTLVLSGSVNSAPAGSDIGEVEAATDPGSVVELDHADLTGGIVLGGQFEVISDATLDGGGGNMGIAVTTFAVDAGATLLVRGRIFGEQATPTTLDPGTGTLVLTGADVANVNLAGGANILVAGALSTIDTGTTLNNGITIGKNQALAFDGLITNPETIALKGPGATAEIESDNGPVQFSGGGTISMPDTADLIAGVSATASLEDIDNSITGVGSIDNLAALTVDAGASIVASGGTLVLDATTINNAGFLGAVPGSVLDIIGELNNTGNLGGLIEFGGPGSGFANGTLPAGGTILVSAPGATFDSIENDGKIIVEPNAVLTLTGDTDNTGEIDLNGSGPGHHANLAISGMLSGGGKIVMDIGDTVNSTGSTPFVNEDNIIEGSGNLGTAGFNFVNHGVVDGNVAANPLLVDPTSPVVQNLSVMEASGGGTLGVVGDLIDTDIIDGEMVDSGIGTLLADGAGSVVALLGGSVTEGLIDSTNGGSVQVQAAETLLMGGPIIILPGEQPPYALDSAFTNFADLQVLAGQTLTLASDGDQAKAFLHNYASVSLLGASGNGATLAIDATTIEIDGGGTLSLNNDADRIIGTDPSDILINDDTISGFGLLGDGQLNAINNGWVVANDATRPLIVNTLGTFTNNNTLAIGATDGGGMVLEGRVTGGELSNAGGSGAFILGGADGAVTLHGGVIGKNTRVVTSATNSTIDAAGSNEEDNTENFGTIAIAPDQNLTMLGQVTNAGIFSDGSTHIEGDIELQVSIDPSSVHHGATLHVGAPTLDLQGFAGQVQLDDAADVIDGAAGTTLISDNNTISGAGEIGTGQLGFVNLSSESLVNATGTLVINGPTTTNNGTLQVSPGGELDIDGAVAGSGMMTVNSGVLTLTGAVAAGQTIEFVTGFLNSETLALADPLAMAGSIESLFGDVGKFDTIDLLHTAATSVNSDGHTLTVMNGAQIAAKLLLESSFNYKLKPDNTGGNFVVVACFAAGTRILTARGEVPVEALRLGDAVVTLHGRRLVPVTWLGHREIDCRRHPNPQAVWPIRVQAGAFGPAMPHADLLLSPDHAVPVDGSLIPIRHLVNGRTIAQEAREEVTYWHVELARHDVLLAEGLPAESYLDTGNRDAFSAGATVHVEITAGYWAPQMIGFEAAHRGF